MDYCSYDIRRAWQELCKKDKEKRIFSNRVADLTSVWLTRLGVKNRREVVTGKHDRVDIAIYDREEIIAIIEVKNYRKHDDYYRPLKQISKYSRYGVPIIFLPSIRQALDVVNAVIHFKKTGDINSLFVFTPENKTQHL